MQSRLTPLTLLLLITPPMLWAGNAVVGRIVSDLIPPVTLNFVRWFIAMIVLLPLGYQVFKKGSGVLYNWRRYAVLGLLGVGMYNGLQYMALHTSTPVNVTLVGASMPVWMLVIGAMFFRNPISKEQITGAFLSLVGVLTVLSHGDLRQLVAMRFVPGDLFMLMATILWAFYSWLLTHTSDAPHIRANWAAFLLAQIVYGVAWSGAFASIEWAVTDWSITWNNTLVFALIYVALGPAVIAYRCWGTAVQKVGPGMAAIFFNLTPLFAAVLSTIILGDAPKLFHLIAFVLIVAGILISTRHAQ